MAEDRCTLIFHSKNLQELPERLKFVFGPEAFEMEGNPDNWQGISIQKRRLIRKVSVTISPIEQSKFPIVQQHLQHLFRVVPTENEKVKEKLLIRLATCRTALEIHAPGGFRGLEEVVFEIAKFFDALIFWENDKILDANGKLVLDAAGNSIIEDLPVVVDAEMLDKFIHKSPEGEERRARSIAYLKAKSIPYTESLPVIDGESSADIRSAKEVAERALALLLVALKGEGLEDEIVAQVRDSYGIGPFLSPNEASFIADSNPNPQLRINFAWRYEALATLLWALGLLEELPFPDGICDVPKVVEIIREFGDGANFIQAAKLRPAAELLDACDLILRLNWACVNSRLKAEPIPAKMEIGVVYERHYALNWLRSYWDQDWDEVRTDT